MRAALAVAAVFVLAGCGGSAAMSAPATTPPAAASAAQDQQAAAPGAAFCAKLRASGTPQVVYAAEVERQVGLASGGGSVTPEAIAAARAIVALWITISCPKFADLEQHG